MALGLAHQFDHAGNRRGAAFVALDRPELGCGNGENAGHGISAFAQSLPSQRERGKNRIAAALVAPDLT
ncbi:hypothetical protein J2Y55_002512 [Bosea sp. BE125]|uniref:hypothetical protein n=1 Tax=Bosea sp. BE125 TaxID=2817909 RepID=UPI00285854D6|nr:hypothetical protein [Bosea sp. BE125]MDR6871500.1 hypothetical protein [Bosea sp. BE125]